MKRVTLDTNILISGTFWTGDSFRILDLIDKKEIICILSRDIINEYDRIIASKEIIEKIENQALISSKAVQRVISDSDMIEPKIRLNIIKEDPSDNMILECAKEGNADFIITNDNHILKQKEFEVIKIITPSEFLKQTGL